MNACAMSGGQGIRYGDAHSYRVKVNAACQIDKMLGDVRLRKSGYERCESLGRGDAPVDAIEHWCPRLEPRLDGSFH
jgi:hypothetical protein